VAWGAARRLGVGSHEPASGPGGARTRAVLGIGSERVAGDRERSQPRGAREGGEVARGREAVSREPHRLHGRRAQGWSRDSRAGVVM